MELLLTEICLEMAIAEETRSQEELDARPAKDKLRRRIVYRKTLYRNVPTMSVGTG
jgi:hypothetical protein